MLAYIKIDEYIVTIQIFGSQYEHKKKFYPSIYKICEIKHMVTNEIVNSIELFDSEHHCLKKYPRETVFFKHNKILHINDIAIYEHICDQDNSIEINDDLIDLQNNNKISFCIINKLYPAYIDEQEAFYENFFIEEQWKLFPNGYSGIYRKYNDHFGDNCEIEEFYHVNRKKEGKHKILYNDFYKHKIKSETNYINGEKIGEEVHYDHNGNCIEKIYNYSDNFMFYEKFNETGKQIKSGYYFMDIPVTTIYNGCIKLRNIFYL
jgi:hypothetical protein